MAIASGSLLALAGCGSGGSPHKTTDGGYGQDTRGDTSARPDAGATDTGPPPHGTIVSFPLPAQAIGPEGITTGPDGNIWFTDALGVGRITPQGEVIHFNVPTGGPAGGITAGPDGNLWFTETGHAAIARMTPAGAITEFPLANASAQPLEITAGPDGNLWFSETAEPGIGRITTAGQITDFPLAESAVPVGIAAGPDGNLWFAGALAIGHMTPQGTGPDMMTPPSGDPFMIATGPDGNLWVTQLAANQIARVTPTGDFTTFPLPKADSRPVDIVAGPDGNLWFTEARGARIGRITPAGTITEIPTPPHPSHITVGPDGNLWFTLVDDNSIAYIVP
jgi:streptogramin lyase